MTTILVARGPLHVVRVLILRVDVVAAWRGIIKRFLLALVQALLSFALRRRWTKKVNQLNGMGILKVRCWVTFYPLCFLAGPCCFSCRYSTLARPAIA